MKPWWALALVISLGLGWGCGSRNPAGNAGDTECEHCADEDDVEAPEGAGDDLDGGGDDTDDAPIEDVDDEDDVGDTPCPQSLLRCDSTCIDPLSNGDFCGAAAPCDTAPGETCDAADTCFLGDCVAQCSQPPVLFVDVFELIEDEPLPLRLQGHSSGIPEQAFVINVPSGNFIRLYQIDTAGEKGERLTGIEGVYEVTHPDHFILIDPQPDFCTPEGATLPSMEFAIRDSCDLVGHQIVPLPVTCVNDPPAADPASFEVEYWNPKWEHHAELLVLPLSDVEDPTSELLVTVTDFPSYGQLSRAPDLSDLVTPEAPSFHGNQLFYIHTVWEAPVSDPFWYMVTDTDGATAAPVEVVLEINYRSKELIQVEPNPDTLVLPQNANRGEGDDILLTLTVVDPDPHPDVPDSPAFIFTQLPEYGTLTAVCDECFFQPEIPIDAPGTRIDGNALEQYSPSELTIHLRYTPEFDYVGSDAFGWTAEDHLGFRWPEPLVVTITVTSP